MTSWWPAPLREHPVDGEVVVPGSKSLTNRVLVLAALAAGPSQVSQPLVSRDTELMAAALEGLGARIERQGHVWTVHPLRPSTSGRTIDCGLAGTVMRFAPPIAALGTAPVTFDGDPRARERPMAGTLAGLRALGVRVEDEGRGTLPFTVHGAGGVAGGRIEVDASSSSQFVSALLLVAPCFAEGLELQHTGSVLPSQPHIDMTVAELRRRGVGVEQHDATWVVKPGPIEALDTVIEPDLSNAGAFVAAALATQGRVRVRRWPGHTEQAGDAWRRLVPAFGGQVRRVDDGVEFSAPGPLRGVDLDLHDVGELTPVLAALAALADSPSRLRGISHLRGHETDRLAALAAEINRLGGDVTETDDGLHIRPQPLHGGPFHTYDDHRMAHAAAVIGLVVPGVEVENIATTAKTYPDFARDWAELVQ